MQLSQARTCPDCSDGKKTDGKICIICRGSGRVHLVPAERENRDPFSQANHGVVYTHDPSIYG